MVSDVKLKTLQFIYCKCLILQFSELNCNQLAQGYRKYIIQI